MSQQEECITCRVTGGAALTGTGIYAVWSSRPKALGSPMGKRLVGLMGSALILAGIGRLLPLHTYHGRQRIQSTSSESTS